MPIRRGVSPCCAIARAGKGHPPKRGRWSTRAAPPSSSRPYGANLLDRSWLQSHAAHGNWGDMVRILGVFILDVHTVLLALCLSIPRSV